LEAIAARRVEELRLLFPSNTTCQTTFGTGLLAASALNPEFNTNRVKNKSNREKIGVQDPIDFWKLE
jgi:hypothetical protein